MQEPVNNRSGLGLLSYLWNEWFSTFSILILLLLTLIIGTGDMIHGQMLRLGERLYGDEKIGMQYSFLRAEPNKPSCDRNVDIDKLVKEKMQQEASDPDAAFFGLTPEADVRASFVSAQTDCEQKYAFYDKSIKHMEDHPSLRTYRSMETGFFWILKWAKRTELRLQSRCGKRARPCR